MVANGGGCWFVWSGAALFFFAAWRELNQHSYFIIGNFEILSPVCFGVFYALVVFRACVGGTRIQTAAFEIRACVRSGWLVARVALVGFIKNKT